MAKGSEYERKISKLLSLWWTNGERDDVFWRTAGSGGRATVRRKQGKATSGQEGDIAAVDPLGAPLTDTVAIELKKGYNSWTIKELIDTTKKNKTLLNFISQCEKEKAGKGCVGWWLITKQDRRRDLLFFDEGFRRFIVSRNFRLSQLDVISLHYQEREVFSVDLIAFLDLLEPSIFLTSPSKKQLENKITF